MKKLAVILCLFAFPLFAEECSDLPRTKETRIELLALNMYHEARNQGYDGMLMVAEVTLNRVAELNFPDTICEVVYDHKQFSWTWTLSDYTPFEEEAWAQALILAEGIVEERIDLLDTGATHFLNPDVVSSIPTWATVYDVVGRVGEHVFYAQN